MPQLKRRVGARLLRIGRRAELAVGDYLIARGFTLLWENLRLGPLELDLVAQRESLVVVVEVRTRGLRAFERPFESISLRKRTTLRRAVDRLWREQLVTRSGVERVRLDAAAVSFAAGTTHVEYVEGAFG